MGTEGSLVDAACLTQPFTTHTSDENWHPGRAIKLLIADVDVGQEPLRKRFQVICRSVTLGGYSSADSGWCGIHVLGESDPSLVIIFPDDKRPRIILPFQFQKGRGVALGYSGRSLPRFNRDSTVVSWVLENARKDFVYELRWKW